MDLSLSIYIQNALRLKAQEDYDVLKMKADIAEFIDNAVYTYRDTYIYINNPNNTSDCEQTLISISCML